jgi:hypothetical protein
MDNIEMKMEKDILVIRIDTKKTFGLSVSGKTIRVASTAGNIEVPGTPGLKIGINAYLKAEKSVA